MAYTVKSLSEIEALFRQNEARSWREAEASRLVRERGEYQSQAQTWRAAADIIKRTTIDPEAA